MKNLKKIFLSVFCFVFAFYFQLNAQQSDSNTIVIGKYFRNISKKANIQNSVKNKIVNYNNNIESTLTQTGNFNYSYIQTSNNKSSHNVTQQGNKNSVVLLSYYGGNNYINLATQQIGNNNSIQVIGNNSIAKKLKITQRANNSAIFVRNYN